MTMYILVGWHTCPRCKQGGYIAVVKGGDTNICTRCIRELGPSAPSGYTPPTTDKAD